MLNIHYGREDLNKDKYIFDNIKGRTLLLVPDQFTLQAERNAFFYMGKKGFMDLEVLSISRLGTRVLRETGGSAFPLINKYGRHMLLTKILEERNDELVLYKNQAGRNSFVEMVNNMISEMKQYGTSPEELADISAGLDEDSYLRLKLEDLKVIYSDYEEAIAGKYTDTEDLNDLYADRVSESELLRENTVWVYGFDSFTPKNIQIITELAAACPDVNVVLTCDDPEKSDASRDSSLFDITRKMAGLLKRSAAERGIKCAMIPVSDSYRITDKEKAAALSGLEKELYSYPTEKIEDPEAITLIQAADLYAQAETAAAQVLHLTRDKGVEYKDIMLICNDLDRTGSITERVFSQHGMDLFVDKKRSLVYSPAVAAIIALIDTVRRNYSTADVIRLLKTGLGPVTWDQTEKLENYAIRYKIRGSMWKKPFRRGAAELGSEEFEELESCRQQIETLVSGFAEGYKKSRKAGDKIKALYDFLTEQAAIPEKLEALVKEQTEAGYMDIASETAQAWNYIVSVLDQMMQIMGDEEVSDDVFVQILEAGFGAIEIGILPPTADGLVMGTMQRTRAGRPGYTLVLSANEGVLPGKVQEDSLLSGDEKRRLFDDDIEICKLDELRVQEEKLAIYRNLTRASEGLWMSYSVSGEDGSEARPSPVFERIRNICGKEPEKDILNRGDDRLLVQTSGSTLRHLTEAVKTGHGKESLWTQVYGWYEENEPDRLKKAMASLRFSNRIEALKEDTVKNLFARTGRDELILSPSALEKYSRCPFAFLIQRGLKPEELTPYEITPLDIGNVYHDALMMFSRAMSRQGVKVTDEDSRWMTITRDEANAEVDRIIEDIIMSDPDGVLTNGKEAEYRLARLRKNCRETVWTLVEDIRSQKIDAIMYEAPFGGKGGAGADSMPERSYGMEPIRIQAGDEEVLIEGRIDRADVLSDERVKVIDYKTGSEKFSKKEAEAGWKLQLMLYLKAADRERKPAGIYYFLIKEPFIDMSGVESEAIKDQIADKIKSAFSFEGISIASGQDNDPDDGSSSDGKDAKGKDKKKKKKSKKDMSPEEFEEFSGKVDSTVEELCRRLSGGDVGIKPKRRSSDSACTFCGYKSICMFERGLGGCDYELI